MTNSQELKIDDEFRSLCKKPTDKELELLEESIKKNGVLDSLKVWDEGSVVIDGHNRYEIATRLGIPFSIKVVSLPDRDSVSDWILSNQLGRRNLTAPEKTEMLGRLLNLRKKSARRLGGGNTASEIAREYGTSASTVERAGKIDRQLSDIGKDAREAYVSGEMSAGDVDSMAAMDDGDRKKVRAESKKSGVSAAVKKVAREKVEKASAIPVMRQKDDRGVVVPGEFDEIFRDRAKFHEAIAGLKASAAIVSELMDRPSGEYIPSGLHDSLVEVIEAVSRARPSTVTSQDGVDSWSPVGDCEESQDQE